MGPTKQGDEFEARVMEQAVIRGLRCDLAPRSASYDLLIAGKRVQCKSKTANNGGFNLHCTRKIARSEFDVLAITYRPTADRPFGDIHLIPMPQIPGDDAQLMRNLRVKWLESAGFIDNWTVFDEVHSEQG